MFGPKDLYEPAKGLKEAFAGEIYFISDGVSQAQIVRVLNNMISLINSINCSEGVFFGAKAGLDIE